jgi:hypothetical protein
VWNGSGSGRISDVGISVVGGANVQRMKCKEDGGNRWVGKR